MSGSNATSVSNVLHSDAAILPIPVERESRRGCGVDLVKKSYCCLRHNTHRQALSGSSLAYRLELLAAFISHRCCSTGHDNVAHVNVPLSHLVLQKLSGLLSSYAGSQLCHAQLTTHVYRQRHED